jgi:hypothetical protein
MRIDLHIPHHKPKPTQDEPNSEGRPNTCRQVIEEVFQNTRRGHPEERWTFSQWYGNWIELELQTLHLEYTPDAIASRKMAKAEFEQLNSHEHRLVTSGEIAGMKYELLEPSKESL